MTAIFRNIRFYVLITGGLFSLLSYVWVIGAFPQGSVQIIRLTQIFALTSLAFLYLTFLAGPFCFTVRSFPFRGQYMHARRALGVLAFYFGLLHACFAFFGQLGGFGGLGFLSNKYLLAISLSFVALTILFLMAATSFDGIIRKLTFPRWKLLHRFVYLAGILTLIHALMLGAHFANLGSFIPQLFFAALVFLLFFEALRFDAYLQQKFLGLPRFGITATVLVGFALVSYVYSLLPEGAVLPLGIHSQHIQIAREAQQGTGGVGAAAKIPGLQGDRTKRYTVSFHHPENVKPNTDVPLSFQVFDAANGNKVFLFNRIYEKIVHFIIVDNDLTYFTHIHPDQKDNVFTITAQFPKEGRYHLYVDFQPVGAIEQQMAFTLDVGDSKDPPQSFAKPDSGTTKSFGAYDVSLTYPVPLQATQLSIGQQIFTFDLKDKTTGQPVTNLKPYLSAFGHLVMINTKTYDYVHVHPADLRVPLPDQSGGPKVEFMPLGLYGPIKPGIYRVFAQFNPDGKLFTSDFTVEIK